MDLARALGWLPKESYINSPRAKPEALTGFHTPEYIAALQAAETTQNVDDTTKMRHALGTPSNPVFTEMYRRPATSAGGTLLAGELLSGGGAIYVPGGGTHHGMPDYANGFCYLNDPVLAIQSLRRNGAKRVAYVDVDAHHPDGVEHAFADEHEVLLISTHEENRWPRTGGIETVGQGNVFNIPLPRGSHDDDMRACLERVILPAVERHRPDAIVLQAGADALSEDPQSGLTMSNGAHAAVLEALLPLAPRFMLLGGGGYNPWSVGRCWTLLWGILSNNAIPDVLPSSARAVLERLSWENAPKRRLPTPRMMSTLRDPPRLGPMHDELQARLTLLGARLLAQV